MARTLTQDPLQSFRYRVNVQGMAGGGLGFQKISGLSREVEVIEYFENMFTHAHKLAGREKVGEITLEKGMFADNSMQKFYERIFETQDLRTQVNIQILDRLGNVAREFNLDECWASKYEVGDLDSSSSDVIVETLTLQFERFL